MLTLASVDLHMHILDPEDLLRMGMLDSELAGACTPSAAQKPDTSVSHAVQSDGAGNSHQDATAMVGCS